MKKKKVMIPLILLVLAAAGACLWFFVFRDKDSNKANGKLAYVERVSTIMGSGIGGETRFMGIVESQETKNVEKEPTKKIKERFVEIGDKVKEGDPLFAYDTEDISLELQQMELDLSNTRTMINTDSNSLQDLRTQRNEAKTEDERLTLTAEINVLVAQINQENYDLEVKQMEYDRKQASLDKNIVYSPMNGVIKAINESLQDASNDQNGSNGNNGNSNNNGENAYITIMEEGDYRVKGTVTEEGLREIVNGLPVIILSRTDSSKFWRGSIEKVNLEPAKESNGGGYYDMGSGDSSSKYTFYVTPDNSEGLVLGQHLYIELDHGQNPGEKIEDDRLFIPSYYIVEEDGNHYVWKKNSKGRLTKAKVSVGEYDENKDAYVIEDGLAEDDYIAYPSERLQEGMKATNNEEEVAAQMAEENEERPGEGTDFYYDQQTGRYFDPDGNEITFDEEGNPVPLDPDMQEENGTAGSGDDAGEGAPEGDGVNEGEGTDGGEGEGEGILGEPATVEE